MTDTVIRKLAPADAEQIVACFSRVYQGTYANRLFDNAAALALELSEDRLTSVGAVTSDGRVLAHMAMTQNHRGGTPELGNTVVDPEARGGGIAWQVGEALIRLCAEAGHEGFLHYPTTAHDIMQKQSLKDGFETGLMLGYIPPETDAQTRGKHSGLRQAATVVYRPIKDARAQQCYAPGQHRSTLEHLAGDNGMNRQWLEPGATGAEMCSFTSQQFHERGLNRLTVQQIGRDFPDILKTFEGENSPCQQLDLPMTDPGIESAVTASEASGWNFCAWLPGFHIGDVLRLQRVDKSKTDMQPRLVGSTAIKLLENLG